MGSAAYKDTGRNRVVFAATFHLVGLVNEDAGEESLRTFSARVDLPDLTTYEFPCGPWEMFLIEYYL